MAKAQSSAKIPRLTEAQLEKQVCDFLAADGWICRKTELNYSERKRKRTGEQGMPDRLCIRYFPRIISMFRHPRHDVLAQVLWIEFKRDGKGVASIAQRAWHTLERKYGAETIIAGEDFAPTIDGFRWWYERKGLVRKE